MEKKESPKGERAVSQESRFQIKMSTEDWVLKDTKLITNTKMQRLITHLIFIFITYYYFAKKKKDPIFKANFIYIHFIIFVTLFFSLILYFFKIQSIDFLIIAF